jgi:hypothetical protein
VGFSDWKLAVVCVDDRNTPEPPDGCVDAERQLPQELGDDQDVHRAGRVPPVEEHAEVPNQEERPSDQSDQAMRRGTRPELYIR